MNKNIISLVVLISSIFVACNKDEEIIIDNPGDNNTELGYEVLEYTPAPGQYINEVANGSDKINTIAEARQYAEDRLANSQYISLGGWGGFIVIKFKSSVYNSGSYDFAIESNTFDSSNEPGIVWVMQDTNKNGIPDEEWFELKGSFFGQEGYERNYWVKYSRPAEKGNTEWEDSNGETGYVYWMGGYHSQEFYYPKWIKEDTFILYGSRLPSLAEQDDKGIWQNLPFDWGYADNFGKDFLEQYHQNRFRISDAVTSENDAAELSSIDFVKVQTGINGSAGWLGENSTEVSGFFILN